MMPDLGDYAVEVLAAYAVTVLLLAAVVAATWMRSVRVRRELSEIEERRRRGET